MLKISAPKWLKMVRGGMLNKDSLKTLAKANFRDRTIRHIGEGSFRRADLVFTGKKGLAVRKIPKTVHESLAAPSEIFKHHAGEHKLWKNIQKDMGKMNVSVSKIVKRKGPVGYYEYVKGESQVGKYDTAAIKELKKMMTPKKMRALKKKYPHLRDINLRNTINGKLIDFDIGKNQLSYSMAMEGANEGGSYKAVKKWLG